MSVCHEISTKMHSYKALIMWSIIFSVIGIYYLSQATCLVLMIIDQEFVQMIWPKIIINLS